MDKQREPLHHNKTVRECEGGVRGLSGLPQEAAEVWRDISGARGFSLRNVGSKPQAVLPNLQYQSQKGT